MGTTIQLEYDQLPSVAPAYLRAAASLLGRQSGGRAFPDMRAHLAGLRVDAGNLARYREVCGFARAGTACAGTLPVTYPHVLAFPLHMAVMTHRRFPLALPGLIHIRNVIAQHRVITADEPLDLTVAVGAQRDVARGLEFDLVTRVSDRIGDAIWTETATMLSRVARRSDGTKKPPEGLPFTPRHESRWAVPGNIGRRYAQVASDYNPIHLSPWTARLFGFKRAIATGMWSLARVAAELTPALVGSAYTLTARFKKPVFLPGQLRLAYTLDATGAEFAATDKWGDVLHLLGSVEYC
jgi:acyl dehydratase